MSAVDVLEVLSAVIDGDCMDEEVLLIEAHAAVAALIEAARMPSAQIVNGFDGPDWVEVSIDEWKAFRAALARVGGAS